MKESITTFLQEHQTALVDLSFNLGYALMSAALTLLILFFLFRYIKKHQKPDTKKLRGGYTKESLLTLFDIFTGVFIAYAFYMMGIKTGLREELTPVFSVMPIWVYSLVIVPVVLLGFSLGIFIADKLDGTRADKTFTSCFCRFLKVGD